MLKKMLLITRNLFIAGVVLVICAIAAILVFHPKGSGAVTLENQTSESIDQASIVVSPQKLDFGRLAPDESKFAKFEPRGESHYEVSITFHSGRQISAQLGYVDSGLNIIGTLIVNSDEVVLAPSQMKGTGQINSPPPPVP